MTHVGLSDAAWIGGTCRSEWRTTKHVSPRVDKGKPAPTMVLFGLLWPPSNLGFTTGLSVSPAAGEAMAHWIVTGEEPFDMSRFRLGRFGSRYDDPDELRRACLERYRHHYVTPGEEAAADG